MSETIKTPEIDKSTWADGPWRTEPDRVDFVHAGFACMILRHDTLGHFCGYVGVPREHPAHGVDAEDVDAFAHGGLNYASVCRNGICHVPEPGMPADVWWLGFDCGHCGDLSPGLRATLRDIGMPPSAWGLDVYRDVAFVRAEVEALADQLAVLAVNAETPAPPGR